jgi:superfamily II DNA or RNA helicase
MEPKSWQADALDVFIDRNTQCFLLEATPAAGKTIFAGFCARHLLETNVADFVLVIVPSTAIKGDSDHFVRQLRHGRPGGPGFLLSVSGSRSRFSLPRGQLH